MKAIERRLVKIEQADRTAPAFHIWADAGESTEHAVFGRFPDGLAENAAVVVYSWAGDHAATRS